MLSCKHVASPFQESGSLLRLDKIERADVRIGCIRDIAILSPRTSDACDMCLIEALSRQQNPSAALFCIHRAW